MDSDIRQLLQSSALRTSRDVLERGAGEGLLGEGARGCGRDIQDAGCAVGFMIDRYLKTKRVSSTDNMRSIIV